MTIKTIGKALVLFTAVLALDGCMKLDGQINGGGTMNSLGGKGNAVFTVAGKRCDNDGDGVSEVRGHVNFQDKTAIDWEDIGGVSFNAEVFSAGLCDTNLVENATVAADRTVACQQSCSPGMFQVDFNYRSTNPAAPGEGTGFVCMEDTGEGANHSYGVNGLVNILSLLDGPYRTYVNRGAISGNLNVKQCGGSTDDEESNG